MRVFFSSLKSASGQIGPVLKRRWAVLIALHVLAFSSSQLLDHWQELALASGREDWGTLIPLFVTSGLLEILLSCAWFVAIAAGDPGFSSLTRYLNSALIETTRSLASVLRWAPALVLPAFVKYLRYLLVPFVVVADDRYERGEGDALRQSEQLSRGYLGLLLSALVFEIFISLALGQIVHGGNDSVFTNAGPALIWGLLSFFINLFTALFLFSIYKSLAKMRAC